MRAITRSAPERLACATALTSYGRLREALLAIFDFIEAWYNSHRRHSVLGYLSPINYERRMAEAA